MSSLPRPRRYSMSGQSWHLCSGKAHLTPRGNCLASALDGGECLCVRRRLHAFARVLGWGVLRYVGGASLDRRCEVLSGLPQMISFSSPLLDIWLILPMCGQRHG